MLRASWGVCRASGRRLLRLHVRRSPALPTHRFSQEAPKSGMLQRQWRLVLWDNRIAAALCRCGFSQWMLWLPAQVHRDQCQRMTPRRSIMLLRHLLHSRFLRRHRGCWQALRRERLGFLWEVARWAAPASAVPCRSDGLPFPRSLRRTEAPDCRPCLSRGTAPCVSSGI